jgi:phosphoadenosine phosphosulfate reductase
VETDRQQEHPAILRGGGTPAAQTWLSCSVITATGTDLQALAEQAGLELEGASAQEVLAWGLDQFHPSLAIACSMADAVVVSLASQLRSDVPVIWLDTGYHFAETVGTADLIEATYPIRLLRVTPLRTVAEQDAEHGARLHERSPDSCCAMRKVEPLERGLAPFTAWASGIRRDETPERATARAVEWDAKRGKVKLNPLVDWTEDDVLAYVAANAVVTNPLLAEGYTSIGCAPCTQASFGHDDPRAGRWAGTGKAECGLHI